MDVCLQGHERSLEEGSCAEAADDLVDDKAGPGGVRFQINEEAVSEGEEDESDRYEFVIAASFLDDYSGNGGQGREAEDLREEVDTAENGVDEEDGLEVEREVVGAAHEDHRVGEADE